MRIQNTTIQNRSKQQRLAIQRTLPRHHLDSPEVANFLLELDAVEASKHQVLFSIGSVLLSDNRSKYVQDFLDDYRCDLVPLPPAPTDAFDLLGSVYQYLNTKAENLVKGSFYTGKTIAEDFVADLDFSNGQVLLDPSCGSGSFLFRAKTNAEQIVGVDVDPLAIMIAKFNYFLKFPDAGPPALYCEDFFTWFSRNSSRRFDYVIGNPPYGAELDLAAVKSKHIRSGESFSYFIEFGLELLRPGGLLRYLVPEALLNVKRHTDVRMLLLDGANLRRVKRYPSKFAGVMSDVYLIEVDRNPSPQPHTLFATSSQVKVPKDLSRGLKDSVLVPWDESDFSIIERARSIKAFDLSASTFALGVVTGDNATKLFPEARCGSEAIYTGKEVDKYALKPPRNHIFFRRSDLQQVAPDEIYRAPEKLVYKVISKDLRFALDTTGALTTNSANLLIPEVPGYDVRAVMALLNSRLYSFLYLKLFGGVNKIGKEHLMALPIPEISMRQNADLVDLVRRTTAQGDDMQLQAYVHESIFGLQSKDLKHIEAALSGD